ncbi:MAG: hypothetical protein SVS15_05440 [Thermodesulfobacteriota bacterium]|nr:hypothetical protein [Thermodesulfobacteriota bacterium]
MDQKAAQIHSSYVYGERLQHIPERHRMFFNGILDSIPHFFIMGKAATDSFFFFAHSPSPVCLFVNHPILKL